LLRARPLLFLKIILYDTLFNVSFGSALYILAQAAGTKAVGVMA
jgi:hypothetical protein